METIYCGRVGDIKKEKTFLEKKLGVKIEVKGKNVTVDGLSFDEYEATTVLNAISFGFPVKTAIMLKDENLVFRIIPIKNFTRRKDLRVVKGRLIGTEGKTKKTIENLADCKVIIRDKEVGVLCESEEVEYIITAITGIIRGSKQSNMYRFLEKINADRK
jgi:ribosomal RNA assembly protein